MATLSSKDVVTRNLDEAEAKRTIEALRVGQPLPRVRRWPGPLSFFRFEKYTAAMIARRRSDEPLVRLLTAVDVSGNLIRPRREAIVKCDMRWWWWCSVVQRGLALLFRCR